MQALGKSIQRLFYRGTDNNMELDPTEQWVINKADRNYLCPITHSIMVHPVLATDGYTYEKCEIERWFNKSGKSPMTNIEITDKTLTINTPLELEIAKFITKLVNDNSNMQIAQWWKRHKSLNQPDSYDKFLKDFMKKSGGQFSLFFLAGLYCQCNYNVNVTATISVGGIFAAIIDFSSGLGWVAGCLVGMLCQLDNTSLVETGGINQSEIWCNFHSHQMVSLLEDDMVQQSSYSCLLS